MTKGSRRTSLAGTLHIRESRDAGSPRSDRDSRRASACLRMTWPRMGRVTAANEFNNRLVRQANRVFEDAAPENPGCDLLLVGKAAIKPVDEDVCINESGHARRGPLFSNLFREAALPDACGGVRSPGRTNGAVTPDFQI